MSAKPPCVHCGDKAPEGKCPGCGTADLVNGRVPCQACGVVQAVRMRDAEPEGVS